MIYQQLIKEYNKLSDEEKNALLIYKSRLGRAINSLDNNEEEIANIYEKYNDLLNNPKNIFIKMTIFKDISFVNLVSFKNSLRMILKKVEEVTTKIEISEDITVYRSLSVKKDDSLVPLSRGNLISTSLNVNECLKFFIPNQDYKHYLYQINLEKGTSVAICPYAVLLNSKEEQLILTQKKDQQELILSKDSHDFKQTLSTTTELINGEELKIIILNASKKVKSNYQEIRRK